MKKLAAAIMFAAMAVPAQAMNVAEFLVKAEALQKKGAMALFSKDFGVLKTEFKTVGASMKADNAAAIKAGQKPAYCAPEKTTLKVEDLMAHMRAIPPAQRGMSFKQGMTLFMKKKYPCPA
jgi:hypothetical protein